MKKNLNASRLAKLSWKNMTPEQRTERARHAASQPRPKRRKENMQPKSLVVIAGTAMPIN